MAGKWCYPALVAAGFALKTECKWRGYYIMAGDGCSDRSTYRFWDGWEHANRARCVEMQVQFAAPPTIEVLPRRDCNCHR